MSSGFWGGAVGGPDGSRPRGAVRAVQRPVYGADETRISMEMGEHLVRLHPCGVLADAGCPGVSLCRVVHRSAAGAPLFRPGRALFRICLGVRRNLLRQECS